MAVKKTTKQFISEAISTHSDFYDYSETIYLGSNKKVSVICPEHGKFTNEANGHLKGHGCLKCGVSRKANKLRFTNEKFITKAKKIHGDKYDYSKVKYNTTNDKVVIVCPIHGEFNQSPKGHLSGRECSKCGYLVASSGKSKDTDFFIKKAMLTHGDKYDYSSSRYVASHEKIKIKCNKHKTFFYQIPANHLRGAGCPSCGKSVNRSKGEIELANFISRYVPIEVSNRSILGNLELDIIIPSKMMAVEYNGNYWHREEHVGKGYHENKTKRAKEEGYQLIHIWEDDYKKDKNTIHKRILSMIL